MEKEVKVAKWNRSSYLASKYLGVQGDPGVQRDLETKDERSLFQCSIAYPINSKELKTYD